MVIILEDEGMLFRLVDLPTSSLSLPIPMLKPFGGISDFWFALRTIVTCLRWSWRCKCDRRFYLFIHYILPTKSRESPITTRQDATEKPRYDLHSRHHIEDIPSLISRLVILWTLLKVLETYPKLVLCHLTKAFKINLFGFVSKYRHQLQILRIFWTKMDSEDVWENSSIL